MSGDSRQIEVVAECVSARKIPAGGGATQSPGGGDVAARRTGLHNERAPHSSRGDNSWPLKIPTGPHLSNLAPWSRQTYFSHLWVPYKEYIPAFWIGPNARMTNSQLCWNFRQTA